MADNNRNKEYKNGSNENFFSKNGVEEYEKVKLQEFYGSIFGNNIEEVKKNSKRLRLKIYIFGLIVFIVTIILVFFIDKINFVSS